MLAACVAAFAADARGSSPAAGQAADETTLGLRADAAGADEADAWRLRARLPLDEIEPVPTLPETDSPPPPELSERARRALARAEELRAADRHTEATIELERALRTDDGHPAVHRAMALVQWEAGDHERARVHIQRALAIRPDDAVSHYLLGRLAARRFENEEAIRQLRLALQCPRQDATESYRRLAQFHLAEALVAEGYYAAAIELYGQFLEGAAAADQGAEANPELAALLRSFPNAPRRQMALAHERLGDYETAAELLKAAYGDREMDEEARLHYAGLLARGGSSDAALREARAAIRSGRAAVDLLAKLHAEQGSPQAVVEDLREIIAEQPENARLAIALAGLLEQFGRGDEAVTLLREKAAALPASLDLKWALFDQLRARGEYAEAFTVAAGAVLAKVEWAPEAVARIEELAADMPDDSALLRYAADVPGRAADFATAFLCGVLAEEREMTDAAVLWHQRSVELKPDFVPARTALAGLHIRNYAWEKAIAVADPDGVELEQDTRLERILGDACRGLFRQEDAARHYEAAIRLNPSNTDAMLALAELYSAAGRADRAKRQLESLIKNDPLNEQAREALFRLYLGERDIRAAGEQIAELRRIAASPTRIARCVAWLEFDAAAPDYEKFRETLRQGIANYREDAATRHLIAMSYAFEGRQKEAIEELVRALELDPHHEESLEMLVRTYGLNLEFEKALETQRQFVARYPNRPGARDLILELLLIVQRFDEAARLAEELLGDPAAPPEEKESLRDTLIQTHLLRGDYDAAIGLLERRMEEKPEEVDGIRWLIETCQAAGKHDRTLELLRRWQNDVPGGLAAGFTSRIWANLQPGQHDDVIRLILDAIDEEPDNDALQIRLIELLRSAGRYDEAIELARNNLAAGRHLEFFQQELYVTYDAADRVDDAIGVINELLAETGPAGFHVFFAQHDLRVALAQLLIKDGRYRQALQKLNRWLDESQTNAEKNLYLQLLALCHQEAGNITEAVQTLKLALELEPGDVELNNNLGYTLADAGRDLEDAEKMIRTAVAGRPRQSAYLDSLGWVLYKQEKFAEAMKWLEWSRYAGDGEDPIICDHLGDTCWRLGRKEEARHWWEEAIRFARERIREVPATEHTYRETLESAQAKLEAIDGEGEPQLAPTGSTAAREDKAPAGEPAGAEDQE